MATTDSNDTPSLAGQKLLVANRGEIAVRILRTAKRLGLYSIAVYTQVDATSPHVLLADEAVALSLPEAGSDVASAGAGGGDAERSESEDPAANARLYLNAEAIADACVSTGATLVHPGYGFLSENASFARLLAKQGITLLGPRPDVIEAMGLKHEARELARKAGVPVVPGSGGLVKSVEEAVDVAREIGPPVMLKATAGGGGMGLVVCRSEDELREKIGSTMQRAKVSNRFNN